MSRKISVTKEQLMNAAYEVAQKEGFSGVTARKIAAYAGCSTQPIFRVYSTMEQLEDEVYRMAMDGFAKFYADFQVTTTVPFVRLGLCYIAFAKEEPHLFHLLFIEKKRCNATLFTLLNGNTNALTKEIAMAKEQGAKDPSGVFMKMWIFIHGAGCMMMAGDYDVDMPTTQKMLEENYVDFSK